MAEFIKALLLVVVAEMGDKTQLLAMAMASKYKVKDVMMGVLIATILNHAIAVVVGSSLGSLIPINAVKMVAGVSFLIFGLWTLRGDKLDDEEKKRSKFGPILTVTITFFIAEMGDKTQLMTLAIAAEGNKPLLTLMGTTAGMLVADSIGIICGAWMCRYVPEKYVKWGAALIFMLFGTLALYNLIPSAMLSTLNVALYFVLLGISIYLFGVKYTYDPQSFDVLIPNQENPVDISNEE